MPCLALKISVTKLYSFLCVYLLLYIHMKNRGIAIILTLLLGGIGGHKFYLGKIGQGLLYLIFFWTLIPAILALIDLIVLLLMSDEDFHKKYSNQSSSISIVEELERYAQLKEKGHISEEEFQQKKKSLLNK